jgi:hypothetical protein
MNMVFSGRRRFKAGAWLSQYQMARPNARSRGDLEVSM